MQCQQDSLSWEADVQTDAVIIEKPEALSVGPVELAEPGTGDVVVDMLWSGISTGTEKLFWTGQMPWFPGFGYPLVPGYEGVGVIGDVGPQARMRPGQRVFVPGASCYTNARGLFGASAARVVVPEKRLLTVDELLGDRAVLLSLAATAQHAIAASPGPSPALVVGHGVLGRLIARLLIARGDEAPTVLETAAARVSGAQGYEVVHVGSDELSGSFATAFDASGDPKIIDGIVPHLMRGGEVVLAGFYAEPVSFAFPPAFMKEIRMRIAAEWRPEDLADVMRLLDAGRLSLDGLISHRTHARDAAEAYRVAFEDPECIKMVLSWRASE